MVLNTWMSQWRQVLSHKRRPRQRFKRPSHAGQAEFLESRLMLTAPLSADDAYDADSNAGVSVDAITGVLANDMDFENDLLLASIVNQPAFGSAYLNGDGAFTYIPNPGYVGTDSYTYQAFDGTEYGNTATVTLKVADLGGGGGGNLTAVDDTFFVEQNSSSVELEVLQNDADSWGVSLSLSSVTTPSNGTSSYGFGASGGSDVVFFSPATGYAGSDSLSYDVTNGTATETATVNLDVHSVDNTIGAARSLSLTSGTEFSVGGIVGDGPQAWSDVDLFSVSLNSGDVLDVDVDAAAVDSGGSLSGLVSWLRVFDMFGAELASAGGGVDPDTDVAGDDAVLSFTAATTSTYYIGISDDFNTSYDPSFSGGGFSNSTGAYELQINRTASNAAPAATADSATTHQGMAVVVDVLANDSDSDGDTLTISAVGAAQDGVTEILSTPEGPRVQYTPAAGFTGSDSFTYTIADPGGLTDSKSVSVVVTNAAPTAVADAWGALMDTPLVVAAAGVLANDTDPDGDSLTAVVVDSPSNGTMVVNGDGAFTYTPNTDYFGADSFTYRVNDGAADSAAATVRLTVYELPTLANDDSYTIPHSTTLNVAASGVLSNDWDFDAQTLSVVPGELPSDGALTLNTNGSFAYTPNAGFAGVDTFTYQATDGTNVSDAATVTIVVTNFAPVASPDFYSLSHDRTLTVAAGGLFLNDVDVEGASLTAEQITSTSNGVLTLLADGSFTYVPNASFLGVDTFSYRISDGFQDSNTVDVTVTVTNTAPVGGADEFYTPATTDLALSLIDLHGNDFDTDADVLTLTIGDSTANGTLTEQPDGSIVYSPSSGFAGFDTFTYTLSDGLASSNPVDVTIKVANTVSLAVADFYTISHDTTLTVGGTGVLSNDVDDDGDSLTAVLVSAPSSGTVTLNLDGTFDYTPNAGFVGDDSFTYRSDDGVDLSAAATVSISTVNGIPVALDDVYWIHHGQSLNINASNGLLTNDSDSDDDILTVQTVSGPVNGALTLTADGSFTYVPDSGFVGNDSFVYQATDGLAVSPTATVIVAVTNALPLTTPDSFSVIHDRVLTTDAATGLLRNDLDPDSDVLTVSVVTQPSSGVLTLAADGSFTYTPNAGFVGLDTFLYSVTDGAATVSPTSVTIDVVNHVPTSVDRSFDVLHDTVFSVVAPGLFAYAADADSDALSVTNISTPANGTLTTNADGSFSYTPTAGYLGTDTFTYQLTDGVAVSSASTVTLDVFNSAPLAAADVYVATHDTTLNVVAVEGLLNNDSDVNSDVLTVTLVSGKGPDHGVLTLNSDGSFDFVPTAGFTGEDGWEYQISDGAETATAEVTIYVVNSAPIATGDIYGVVPDTTLSISGDTGVLANDVDGDNDALTATLVDTPINGTVTLQSDGSFTYTPSAGFVGVDEFTYKAKDTLNAESGVTTVSVSTALVAMNDDVSLIHDTTVSGNVFDNDFDSYGDPLKIVMASGASGGVLTLDSSGNYTLTPDTGFVGQVTFSYYLDNGAIQSNTATVTFDVTNYAPQVLYSVWDTPHGQTLNVDVTQGLADRSRDRDDDVLTFQLVQAPTYGALTVNSDGSFIYVPTDPSFVGADSFLWTASDGVATSEQQTTLIELTNFKADVSDDLYTTHSLTDLSVTALTGVLFNDSDIDGDTLTAEVVIQPTKGTVTFNADGSFVYSPGATIINATDTFTYRVHDGAEYSESATVTVDIQNSLPVTYAEEYRILHDSVLSAGIGEGVLNNDYDTDGDALAATVDQGPAHGLLALNADGSFSYTPNANYVGADSFTYVVSDGIEQTTAVTATVQVTNIVPVAIDDLLITRRGQALTFTLADLAHNDSDADDDTLTIGTPANPVNGTLVDNGDGTWTYTPPVGFVGQDSFTYRVNDGVVDSPAASVTVDVLNAAPNTAADRFEVGHSQTLTVASGKIQNNDSDLENDALVVAKVNDTEHGTLILNADGAFTYTPDAGFEGRDGFTYTLSDGDLVSEAARVVIDVINTRPVAHDSWQRVLHDTTLTIDQASGLIDSATDGEDDTLTLTIDGGVNYGTLTVQADGSWTYVPIAGFVGTDSFTYRVSDGVLPSTTATVLIDVFNTPVVASLDAYSTLPDTALNIAAPGVLQNDSDIDGDALTLTVIDDVRDGTLSLAQDGSFTYTPDSGYVGADSFTYRVADGIDTAIATVLLTVSGVNSSPAPEPVAHHDFYSVTHSQALDVSVLSGVLNNDSDPDQDALTAQLVSGPAHGTLTFNTDGSFLYTPDPGDANTAPFAGLDIFSYQATDGSNTSTAATVELNVVNRLPWAVSTAFDVHQNQPITTETGVLSRFTGDLDGDTLVYTKLSDPANGALTFNADGTFDYIPNSGFVGTDSFTFRVNDGVGDSQTASVALDVTNERPTAGDLEFRTQHDVVLSETGRGVLSAASDRDSDDLTAAWVSGPAGGSVVVNADGTFDYTPNAGFSGTDEFRFRVFDGAEYSYEAVVTVGVDNQAPTALASGITTKHDAAVVVALSTIDGDGDSVTYELVTAPQHGTLTYDNLMNDGSNGQPVTFSGNVSWQPDTGFAGDDSFDFKATDGVTFSNTATVSLKATNLTPHATSGVQTTDAGQSLVVAEPGLLANAFDGDGDNLTLEIVTSPANGTATLTLDAGDPTGGYTYTPNAGFAGQDSFTWRVHDGVVWSAAATETITVGNTAPVLSDHWVRLPYSQGSASGSGRAYTIDLAAAAIASDVENDALTYEIVSQAQSGTATLTTAGQLGYTSTSAVFTGKDVVTIRVSDGYQNSETATITLDVENARVIATNDYLSVESNTLLTFTADDLLGNDADFDGDALQLVSVTIGTEGTLTENNGTYTFDPGSFTGTTELTYVVSDGVANSDPVTISVDVKKNLGPEASDQEFRLHAGESVNIDFPTGRIWDPEGDALTFQIVTQPAFGTFSIGPTGASFNAYVDSGAPDPGDPYGNIATLRMPTGTVTATFTVSDGITTTAPVTYSFQVLPSRDAVGMNPRQFMGVNDTVYPSQAFYSSGVIGSAPSFNQPPVASRSSVDVRPGEVYSGNLLTSVTDPEGDSLTVTVVNDVAVPSGVPLSITTDYGEFTVSADGTYTYTSDGSTEIQVLTFEVSDETTAVPGTLVFDASNHAPMALASLSITATEGASEVGNLLLDVIDRDDDVVTVSGIIIDSVTYPVAVGGSTVSLDQGDLTIQPNGDYVFSLSGDVGWVDAEILLSDTYTETVEDLPIARLAALTDTSSYSTSSDETLTTTGAGVIGNVLANDSIPAGASVTVAAAGSSQGVYGSFTLQSDGDLEYSLDANGTDGFLQNGGEPQRFAYTYSYSGTDGGGNPYSGSGSGTTAVGATLLKPGEWITDPISGNIAFNDTQGADPYLNFVPSEDVFASVGPDGASFGPVDPDGTGSYSVHGGGPTGLPGASWSGDAGLVRITAAGAVTVSGNITQINSAGNTIGLMRADVVMADALQGLAGVIARAHITLARSGQSIGIVHSQGTIDTVHAGYIDGEGNITPGGVSATGSIDDVFATGSVSSITAASIGTVMVGDVGDVIAESGAIGQDDSLYPYINETYYGDGGIVATRSISGNVIANGPISFVVAGENITSDMVLSRTGRIGLVETGLSNAAKLISAATTIDEIVSYGDINTGPIYATNRIGLVSAVTDVLAPLITSQSIDTVHAGERLESVIAATAGSIGHISARTIVTPVFMATDSIGLVDTTQADTTGSIEAGLIVGMSGGVGDVLADQQIEATIYGTSIGNVIGGRFQGELNSSSSIGEVKMVNGAIDGTITATTSVGPISAATSISGSIQADVLESVTATSLSIFASVTSGTNIGPVSAGTDITGDITATNGSIQSVAAGTNTPGDISGAVSAKTRIGSVTATGKVVGDTTVTAPSSLDIAAFIGAGVGGALPKATKDFTTTGGNISGDISADDFIGAVSADGDIGAIIKSIAGQVKSVFALGDISKDITSNAGVTVVTAKGEISGVVSTVGGAAVSAFGDVSGRVEATDGFASVSTWGNASDDVIGELGVSVAAWGDVSNGEITSNSGSTVVTAMGDVLSKVDAAMGVIALSRKKVDVSAGLNSDKGAIFTSGVEGINAKITAHNNVYTSTSGKLQGSILSETGSYTAIVEEMEADVDVPESIYMVVQNRISSKRVRSGTGSVSVEAGSIGGSRIEAPAGSVLVNTFGEFTGSTATASGSVLGRILGPVSFANFKSTSGDVILTTLDGGDVRAESLGSGNVSVVSWGPLSGRIGSTTGNVSGFVLGDISSTVSAGGTTDLSVWGSVNGTVSGDQGVTLFARQDVVETVTSQAGDISVVAGGSVQNKIDSDGGSVTITALGSVDESVDAITGISVDADSASGALHTDTGDISVVVTTNFDGGATTGARTAENGTDNVTYGGGGDIDIAAGGSIQSSAPLIAGGSVTLLAIDTIDGVTINAGTVGIVSSIASVTGVTVNAKSAAVSGLSGVDVTVVASEDVVVYSGVDVAGTVTSTTGDIAVVAVSDVTGSYTTSGSGNVAVTAFQGASGLTVDSSAGEASAFGVTSIDGTISGVTVSALSLGTISGTISGDDVTVFGGSSATVNVTAQKTASVSGRSVGAGTIRSYGTASVVAIYGDVSANVLGTDSVDVSALDGSVTGTVTSDVDTVTVFAATDATGAVTAKDSASVSAHGDITSTVSAGQDAQVSTYGNVNATISSTNGSVSVYAGEDVSGTITAATDASVVSRTADVGGSITSQNADVYVQALGGISSTLTADNDASAVSLGEISGTINATNGSVWASTIGGQVTGTITAATDVSVIGFDGVSSAITATAGDAGVFSAGIVGADITAGKSIGIFSYGTVNGSQEAGDSVGIIAFGQVKPTSTTATAGSIFISSPSGVEAMVLNAGDSIGIVSGGNTVAVANPVNDFFLMSMGDSNTLDVTAANGDSVVWTAGSVAGAVRATAGDVVVMALNSFAGLANAGQDVVLLTFESLFGIVTAGGDAIGVTMGTADSPMFTAGEDAFLFSMGAATDPALTAGGTAGVITMESAAFNSIISGTDGAFAWTGGNFGGNITSSAGPAGLTTIGGASGASVSGTSAAVVSIAGFTGGVTATDGSAAVITLLDTSPTVTATEDIVILSEGSVSGSGTAGDSIGVLAYGDVTGTFTGNGTGSNDPNVNPGGQAALFTYGSFDGSLHAPNGGAWAYAVGDFTGPVTASAVDEVFSHGRIIGQILGSDTVESVTAWGPIDGSITAGVSIGIVRSADAVNATLNAPSAPTPIENDPNLIAETPIPDVPASIRADILAEVTAAIADAQAQRAQAASDIADMKADFATARSEAANDIAEMKADVATAVDEARPAAVDALAGEKDKVGQELSEQVAALTADIAQLVTLTNADRAKIIAGNLKAQQDAAAAAVKMQQANAALADVFSQMDIDLQSQRDQILAELQSAIAQRQQAWDMYVLVQGQKMAELSGGHMSTPGESYWDTFLETWSWSEYFSGVGSVFKGEFNAVANTAAGVWQVLRHPIDTTKAVGSAIYNWRNTIKVILNDFVQKSQTLEGQGEIGGDILLGILTGGALKSLKESGRLAKVLDKVKDVAKTTANNAAKRLPDLPTAGSRAPAGLLQVIQKTCFVAGTPVLTPDGPKAIDQFKVGDQILSRPQDNPQGPVRTSVVEELFKLTAPIMELRLGGQTIATTAEHPFYVAQKGWVRAENLESGDLLVGDCGEWTSVDSIRRTKRHEPVFNVRVAVDHTYFIGDDDWGFSVWVHNAYSIVQAFDGSWKVLDEAGEIVEAGLTQNAAGHLMRNLNALASALKKFPDSIAMDIRQLKAPMSRQFAKPEKLKLREKFDWIEYRPIEVMRHTNGTFSVSSGMTRLTLALREGIRDLPVVIIN